MHCFHNCFWQDSRGKCKPDVHRNTLLVRKRRKQALHSRCPQPLPGALCKEEEEAAPFSPQASAGVAAALLFGTLQAGETYGNVILLLLGKQGAVGLRNEHRA